MAASPRPVPVVPSDKPFEMPMPDWSDKKTWVKAALLAGAVLLVKMSFRKMKDDEQSRDE